MWDALKSAAEAGRDRSILGLFDGDPDRAEAFSLSALDLLFDYSKTQIDATTRDVLIDLAKAAEVEARRDAMFTTDPRPW